MPPATIDHMKLLQPADPVWVGRALSILRIVVGLVFRTHGTMKLFGFPSTPQAAPVVELFSQRWLAGVLEAFGGVAILLGFLTRPVAFILSGEMAVAYFQAHFPRSVFPTVNGGVSAVLYCFIFLFLAAAGGGPWSVDAVLLGGPDRRPPRPGG
jgi:putative oxidoreductase